MAKVKIKRPTSGCLYLFGIGLVAILLFSINILVVQSLTDTIPVVAENQQVKQFILLVVPVGMVLAEFWFYDFITDLLDRRIA